MKTVYVIKIGKAGKVSFSLTEHKNVEISVDDGNLTLTATVGLEEFMEIATNLEMDSVPEKEKK